MLSRKKRSISVALPIPTLADLIAAGESLRLQGDRARRNFEDLMTSMDAALAENWRAQEQLRETCTPTECLPMSAIAGTITPAPNFVGLN